MRPVLSADVTVLDDVVVFRPGLSITPVVRDAVIGPLSDLALVMDGRDEIVELRSDFSADD